ncbi:MAG: hypothetical protein JJT93_16360 [Gammaproteobacteria bacterium]|nr:hypothetical protein [Gammaproteobacteria bacterium]
MLTPRPVYLYDISLPIRDMAGYVDAVGSGVQARWPCGACYVIGHVADGNLHLFIRPNEQGDWHEYSESRRAVDGGQMMGRCDGRLVRRSRSESIRLISVRRSRRTEVEPYESQGLR